MRCGSYFSRYYNRSTILRDYVYTNYFFQLPMTTIYDDNDTSTRPKRDDQRINTKESAWEAEEGRGLRGSRRVFFSFYALLTFIYSYTKYVKHPTNDDGTGSGYDASRAPSVLTTTTTERRTTTTKGAREAYASRAPGMFFPLAPGMFFYILY